MELGSVFALVIIVTKKVGHGTRPFIRFESGNETRTRRFHFGVRYRFPEHCFIPATLLDVGLGETTATEQDMTIMLALTVADVAWPIARTEPHSTRISCRFLKS